MSTNSKTSSRAQITRFAFWATVLTSFIMILMDNRHALDAYEEYAKASALSRDTSELSNPISSELISAKPEGKNLVAFVALGARPYIATIHHNVHAHFLGWDCSVFVHKDESEIPTDDPLLKDIGLKCSIVRLPGLYWSHFLMTLTPELVQQYEYIAVVLDDLFAPVHGDTAVNMSKLLQRMKQYNLSSISPSVKGAAWPSTRPTRPRKEPCLWHVHQIETFFQIFSRDLFNCWRSFMHFANRQGFCLDVCLDKQLCPSISNLAIDGTMIAYHLGQAMRLRTFVPKSALVGTHLTIVHDRPPVQGDERLCEQQNCSFTIPEAEQLQCDV